LHESSLRKRFTSGASTKHSLTIKLERRSKEIKEERKKERLRQQGNPYLRELRKKFTSGASTRQISAIKLGRRSSLGGRRVLKIAMYSSRAYFEPPTCTYYFFAY